MYSMGSLTGSAPVCLSNCTTTDCPQKVKTFSFVWVAYNFGGDDDIMIDREGGVRAQVEPKSEELT